MTAFTRERYNARQLPQQTGLPQAQWFRKEFQDIQRGVPWPVVIDIRDFDVRPSDDVDTRQAFAAHNVREILKASRAAETLAGATINIPETASGHAYMFGATAAAGNSVIPLPPYTNLKIDGKVQRQQGTLGGFLGVSYHNRVSGIGTIDGNSTLTAVRGIGTNLIKICNEFDPPGSEEPGYFWINGLKWIRSPHFAMNLRGSHMWVWGNDVDSTWGSVDGEEPDDLSGDNCDGIHFINSSNIWCWDNSSQAVDDCIAVTFNNAIGDTTDFENINIFNNRCRNRKAQNVADAGLGSSGTAGTVSKFAGGGIRIAEESGAGSGLTVEGVRIEGNELRGGTYGVVMRDLDIADVRIHRNRLRNIMADAADPEDYDFAGGPGRTGAIFCSGGEDVEITDNRFRVSGIPFIRVLVSSTKSSTEYRIAGNRMRGLDTSLCGLAVTSTVQRVGIEVGNTHATNDMDDVIVEDNIGDDIDGGFIYVARESTGDVTGMRFRNNRCSNTNTSGQTDARSAAYSLKNGAQASGIEIVENVNNKVLDYDISSTTNATESFCETVESQSVLVDIPEWTDEHFGTGKMFTAVNGSGTMTATLTAQRTLHCSGSGANDEVRTGTFSAAPWLGRVMEVSVLLYIVSGSVQVHNAQRSVTIAADTDDRWKLHHVTLSADETTSVRIRFICAGGAAEFYVGRLTAVLSNV